MFKLCKKCNVEKPRAEFYASAQRKDGLYPHCKDCHQAYMRNRYAAVPGVRALRIANHKQRLESDPQFRKETNRRSREHYASLDGRASAMLRNAQRSPDGCTLNLDWIIAGIRRGCCPVTGIAFDLTNGHQQITGRAKNPYSPSLDRINPKGPYSPENTRVVIWQYNMMKGELSDGEVAEICRRILTCITMPVAA